MRISDRYDRFSTRAFGPAPTAATKPAAPGAEKAPSKAVHVAVSSVAADLAAATQRLDRLKAEIAAGSYRPDPAAIASKMVGEGG